MSDTSVQNRPASGQEHEAEITVDRSADPWHVKCSGDWTVGRINKANIQLKELAREEFPGLEVDSSNVKNMDTSGAWIIERLRRRALDQGKKFNQIDSNPQHIKLVNVVRLKDEDQLLSANKAAEKQNFFIQLLDKTGRAVVQFGSDFVSGLYLVGNLLRSSQMKEGHSGDMRVNSIMNQLDQMGWQAIPVISLMSFLIGAIIAQEGAYQLKPFGEELLTVDMVAILHFREIGVLLTAIMVAGRSGSAITAELGIMKMREEIDALHVMGLNPIGVLILPRVIALIIALPMLTLLSDVSGILGGMFAAQLYAGITPDQFLSVLRSGDWVHTVMAGLIKAPFMALIIGITASVEGLKVGGSSESLGLRTTSSVVRSIFAVIVVDGVFAVFYTAIGF